MKILFVSDRRVNAGSIQAVASYIRAGDLLGHSFALYGPADPRFPGVRFATDAGDFDHVIFIFESNLRWLSGLHLVRLLTEVPRSRRAILDADGMYNQRIVIDGYDRNYADEQQRLHWLSCYEQLADRILQPTLTPLDPSVQPLLFYGYDSTTGETVSGAEKRYDLLHVGHNWWRWREMDQLLLPALEGIRAQLDGVCFIGSWWDAVPSWAPALGLQEAFAIDPERLRRCRIQVKPPTSYAEVIAAMSRARVNLMTQRPLFRHLRILTSKFFEIFCADTIPLVLLDPEHAQLAYGEAGRQLALHENIGQKIVDVLTRPRKYQEIVQEVRRHLATHHSYRGRVRELLDALNNPLPEPPHPTLSPRGRGQGEGEPEGARR